MERLINILIIDDNKQDSLALNEILSGNGNILLFCKTLDEADEVLKRKEVGVILVNVESELFPGIDVYKNLLIKHPNKTHYSIIITDNTRTGSKIMKGFGVGIIDFILKPFNPILIQAKLDIYKSLYYKDKRISQLLGNIFPENVLESLNQFGKFSPKRADNGVVLFTDFVDFSLKAKSIKPIKLLKRLEYYFTAFDEIVDRYELEKIKTIGDAYMALAGVNENNNEPILRACFAAIEMRNFMRNEKELAKAMKRDYWEIRIGVHAGPLVAGIIGTKRFSFDVWGDTVNIAARAQQVSGIDQIAVTQTIIDNAGDYFVTKNIGNVPIKKRGGAMEMYELEAIKPEYSLYHSGKVPSVDLRVMCEIETVDFNNMRTDIINKLKSMLPEEVVYHDLGHTENVEKAAIRFGKLEGLTPEEMMLVRTAALFHDSGFIFTHQSNELHGVRFMEQTLPKYGFTTNQIAQIRGMILATAIHTEPDGLLQQILCDADHDYLGRADYYIVAQKLFDEMRAFGIEKSEEEWLLMQIEFLEKTHQYYTISAKNIRNKAKLNRLNELKEKYNTFIATTNQS